MTRSIGVLVVVMAFVASASADKQRAKKKAPPPPPPPPVEEPAGSAAEAEMPPHLEGPQLVDLGNSAEIQLPAGHVLYEREVAQKLERDAGDDWETVVAIVERS